MRDIDERVHGGGAMGDGERGLNVERRDTTCSAVGAGLRGMQCAIPSETQWIEAVDDRLDMGRHNVMYVCVYV